MLEILWRVTNRCKVKFVINNYSSSPHGPKAEGAIDSEVMRVRGIIVLVQTNYLVNNIKTKQP